MDGIRYRCRHPASSLFGPSRHCGLGLMNGPRFRYRQGLFDLLSRWPIMWTMRFVGVRRPISAFGPPDATHFYVLYQFLLQHLFFIPEASLPIKEDSIIVVSLLLISHPRFATLRKAWNRNDRAFCRIPPRIRQKPAVFHEGI